MYWMYRIDSTTGATKTPSVFTKMTVQLVIQHGLYMNLFKPSALRAIYDEEKTEKCV